MLSVQIPKDLPALSIKICDLDDSLDIGPVTDCDLTHLFFSQMMHEYKNASLLRVFPFNLSEICWQ